MNIRCIMNALPWVILFVSVSGWCGSQPGGIAANTQHGPVAYLPVSSVAFETVLEGESVTHEFTIRNKGTGKLRIEKIRTGCGCATTAYTKTEIPAGGEGKVVIRIKTDGYGGKHMVKRPAIFTNDKNNPKRTLRLSGYVEKFAHVTPKIVKLSGKVGDRISSTVRIVPAKKYPFRISQVKMKKGANADISLKEITNEDGGVEYVLTVSNTKREAGRYFDAVALTTDNDKRPELKIRVYGDILGN